MRPERSNPTLVGQVRFRSHLLSNQWILEQNGQPIAQVRRLPRHRMSSVRLADGTQWTIEPRGWGAIEIIENGTTIARADRKSFVGRLWEISSQGFAFNLVSRRRPRRWYLSVGNEPVAELSGSIASYNRLRIDSAIGVPIAAVLLAWQVVVRPWEAAAFPLRPTLREQLRLPESRGAPPPPQPPTNVASRGSPRAQSPIEKYVRGVIDDIRPP